MEEKKLIKPLDYSNRKKTKKELAMLNAEYCDLDVNKKEKNFKKLKDELYYI